jgi:hypothetical protein
MKLFSIVRATFSSPMVRVVHGFIFLTRPDPLIQRKKPTEPNQTQLENSRHMQKAAFGSKIEILLIIIPIQKIDVNITTFLFNLNAKDY